MWIAKHTRGTDADQRCCMLANLVVIVNDVVISQVYAAVIQAGFRSIAEEAADTPDRASRHREGRGTAREELGPCCIAEGAARHLRPPPPDGITEALFCQNCKFIVDDDLKEAVLPCPPRICTATD